MLALSQNDFLSEQLVAQLLEEDLQELEFSKQAEKLQLNQILTDSCKGTKRIPRHPKASVDDVDSEMATKLMAQEVRLASDANFAQALQHSTDVNHVASEQMAQRLAATERKILLDAEFAKRLQEADDAGDMDTDAPNMRDAESVLGQEFVDSLMAGDRNTKGKGRSKRPRLESDAKAFKIPKTEEGDLKVNFKGKARLLEGDVKEHVDINQYPTCGICLEPFKITYSPLSASLSANSSSRLPFGLRLPCPSEHAYCIDCLSHYIKAKLEPEEDGQPNSAGIVFPIKCPECPRTEWENGIPDEVAEKLLDEKAMVSWHHQKLLDSLPRTYCPNPRCSALLQVDEDPEEPQATCPACQSIVCIPCKTLWHSQMSCEEYQALPLDERSPDDQLALQLAKAKNWRRCPSCTAIIELTQGCHHITCRCSAHFCFKCGSLWDIKTYKCTSNPPCALWEEDMLLDVRERGREAEAAAAADRAVPAHAHANALPQYIPPFMNQAQAPPPYAPRAVNKNDFEWLEDPDIVCGRHPFTTEMMSNLTCGYCNNRLNSLADLQYHLGHVRYHPVFACCGKLFKREVDLERHLNSYPGRFGQHVHEIRR